MPGASMKCAVPREAPSARWRRRRAIRPSVAFWGSDIRRCCVDSPAAGTAMPSAAGRWHLPGWMAPCRRRRDAAGPYPARSRPAAIHRPQPQSPARAVRAPPSPPSLLATRGRSDRHPRARSAAVRNRVRHRRTSRHSTRSAPARLRSARPGCRRSVCRMRPACSRNPCRIPPAESGRRPGLRRVRPAWRGRRGPPPQKESRATPCTDTSCARLASAAPTGLPNRVANPPSRAARRASPYRRLRRFAGGRNPSSCPAGGGSIPGLDGVRRSLPGALAPQSSRRPPAGPYRAW